MPELPEVETVINGIKPRILNQKIQDCTLSVSYTHLTLPTNREV